jgi:hypothetical protein
MSRKQATLKVPLTLAQRKAIAEVLPRLADRLKLDEKNSRTISLTSGEAESILRKAKDAVPHADSGMKRNSLRHVVEVTSAAIGRSRGIGSIPASERLYQFKITLLESQPPIWRRIQVKDCTVDKLHEHIQTAMGWTNSHLHQFDIDGKTYGDPQLLDHGLEDQPCIDSTVTKISEILPEDGKQFPFRYEYDFGDSWQHEVLFEGCLRAEKRKRYPVCLEGERACPPEDSGGVWGYADLLEALADPDHEEHEDCVEWAGDFDPERFDAGDRTKAMRRGLPDWREWS